MMEFGEGFFLHLDLVPTTAMLVKYPLEKQQINEETKLLLHLGMTYSKVSQKTIHRLVVVVGHEESR